MKTEDNNYQLFDDGQLGRNPLKASFVSKNSVTILSIVIRR